MLQIIFCHIMLVCAGIFRLHRAGAEEGLCVHAAQVPGDSAATDQGRGTGRQHQHRRIAQTAPLLRPLGAKDLQLTYDGQS